MRRGVASRVLAALLGLVLVACSDDTSQINTASNISPIANAGPDQSVAAGVTVTLAGSGTDADGSITSFGWVQVSGPAVTLSNRTVAGPSFTAPSAPTATTLGFRLTVTDNRGTTASDEVLVSVAGAANQAPSANAGPDQTVASGTVVTLAGSGSDADGTITSFSWSQISGISVTLSNANANSPSFTAPTSTSSQNLGFRLTVTDNSGATATDEVQISVAGSGATTVKVSGAVTFDRVHFKSTSGQGLDLNNPASRPARGVTVQALDADNLGATPLATTSTDSSGNYSLSLPLNTNVVVRVRAETVRSGTPAWDFSVVDNTSSKALYVLDSSAFSTGSSDQTKNLHAASGWDGSSYTGTRAAAPFAILDSVYDSFQKTLAVDATAVFPKLTINWSVNNVNTGGNLPAGLIGTSFYSNSELYILGKADVDTDEFDDHIIVHEWGHYFEDKLSKSDSIGGEHSASQLLDMRVAFGEGFGNALSGIVTDDPAYRDSSGASQASDFTINVESNPTAAENSGWFSESSVQSILYDLYDATADGSDSVNLGWGPLYTVFVNEQKAPALQTSIFTFITALKDRNPAAASGINTILADQRINGAGIDNRGSQETNSGGASNSSDVLPIYTDVGTGGGVVTVCSINEFGEPNKLSSRRFLTFSLASTANLSVNVTGGSDPDLVLHKRGQVDQAASTSTAGSESLTATSSPSGTYVLEVYDSANTDGSAGSGGRACLNVSVTAN